MVASPGGVLLRRLSPRPFAVAGLRQPVQPAGHSAHCRDELQNAPGSRVTLPTVRFSINATAATACVIICVGTWGVGTLQCGHLRLGQAVPSGAGKQIFAMSMPNSKEVARPGGHWVGWPLSPSFHMVCTAASVQQVPAQGA